MARHLEQLPSLAESAVRYRIRKKWERRRAESAGRSEAFHTRRYGLYSERLYEVPIPPRDVYTVPERTVRGELRPAAPRNLAAVKIRLVQPR